MDTHQQITHLFSCIPIINEWEEVRSLFLSVAAGKPFHWSLPVLACEAVGGIPDRAVPAALAIAFSHVSIILVDDMLDSDPRGEYRRLGMPAAANMACALQSAALAAISLGEVKAETKIALLDCINGIFLRTTLGQYWDAQSPAGEEAYWRVVRAKSSPFFGAALQAGALSGGSAVETAGRLKELGCIYGEMIQIHDDLNDTLTSPANPDWTEGRSPLPILFARLVEHPDRTRFLHLSKNIHMPGNLEEAQDILIRSGAVSYCVDQLLRRHRAAREILDPMPLPRRELLDDLLEEVIAPVRKLFRAIDELPPTVEPARSG